MAPRRFGGVARLARGIRASVRARPGVFVATAAGVFGLNVLLPPLVLSLARKPWDFFTFNPWLKKLPEYLVSGAAPLRKKLDFLSNLALFWFSSDSPYGGVDWGFAVTVSDVGRFILMSLLFGTYFALWFFRRDRLGRPGWGGRAGRPAGVFGAFATTFGLSTGPCTVMGCGAPVIPVLGLAFVGLSSGTLAFLATLSRVATAAVLVAAVTGVVVLAWQNGGRPGQAPPGAPAGR